MEITPAIRTRYRAYLQTEEWRTRRNRALKLASFRCVHCGTKRALEVHHRTYERLGEEWDSDLKVLCHDCHAGHHLDAMEETSQALFLKLAREVVRQHPWEPIGELAQLVSERCAKLKIRYDNHQVDKALHLICGASKLQPVVLDYSVEATRADMASGREISPSEAREILHRLFGGDLVKTLIKQMPFVSLDGLDDPIPRDDYVEHDRY